MTGHDLEVGIGAGAALFLGLYPLTYVVLEACARARDEAAAFEAHLRRRGGRPAHERTLRQLGDPVALEDVYDYVHPPTDT